MQDLNDILDRFAERQPVAEPVQVLYCKREDYSVVWDPNTEMAEFTFGLEKRSCYTNKIPLAQRDYLVESGHWVPA